MTEDKAQPTAEELDLSSLERVIAEGDLSKLTPKERFTYYMNVCASVGVNPYTQPFKYMRLNNQLKLYATKDCGDQLRRRHKISITFDKPDKMGDVMYVKARAKMPSGRMDEDLGAVNLGNARGEQLANCLMKAHTKAKRRVTLSICGLGDVPDEEELATMDVVETVSMEEAQGQAPAAVQTGAVVEQVFEAGPVEPQKTPPGPDPNCYIVPGGSDPQGPPSRPNPDVFHTDAEVKSLIDSGAIKVDPETAARFADPLPDEPPIGFDDEPAPPKAPPPTPSSAPALPQVMIDAMGKTQNMEELSDIAKRVMDLKFEESELVTIREAYKVNKVRLRS